MTDYEKHYSPSLEAMTNFSSKVLLMSNPTPDTFSQLPIGCQAAEASFPALSLVIETYGSL